MGCLFVFVVLFVAGIGAAGAWAIGTATGVVHSEPPVRLLAVLALVGAAGLVAAGFRTVRRFAAPVDELIGAAGRIEAGDYAARVPERGPREVRALAGAFNAMSARLEANEQQRRRFLADIAHELRTPLSVVQGQFEGVIDGVYPADAAHLEPVLDEVRDLERLVEDLRTLSLAETGALLLVREPVEPALLVHDALVSFRGLAEAAGVDLRSDVARRPAVRRARSGAAAPGARQPRRERTAAHAGRRVGRRRRATGGRHARAHGPGHGRGDRCRPAPARVRAVRERRGESRTGLGLAIARDLVVGPRRHDHSRERRSRVRSRDDDANPDPDGAAAAGQALPFSRRGRSAETTDQWLWPGRPAASSTSSLITNSPSGSGVMKPGCPSGVRKML